MASEDSGVDSLTSKTKPDGLEETEKLTPSHMLFACDSVSDASSNVFDEPSTAPSTPFAEGGGIALSETEERAVNLTEGMNSYDNNAIRSDGVIDKDACGYPKRGVTDQEQQTTSIQSVMASSSSQTEGLDQVTNSDDYICSRHKTEKTKRGFSPPSENATLCRNCSKSMLSYLMLMQQFLDNVTKDVSRQVDPLSRCYECVKESLHLPKLATAHTCPVHTSNSGVSESTVRDVKTEWRPPPEEHSKYYENLDNSKPSEAPQASKQNETVFPASRDGIASRTDFTEANTQKPSSGSLPQEERHQTHLGDARGSQNIWASTSVPHEKAQDRLEHYLPECPSGDVKTDHSVETHQQSQDHSRPSNQDHSRIPPKVNQDHSRIPSNVSQDHSGRPSNFNQERTLPNGEVTQNQPVSDLEYYLRPDVQHRPQPSDSTSIDSIQVGVRTPGMSSPQFPHSETDEGILNTLYKVERGLRDVSKGPTVWQRLEEMQYEHVSSTSERRKHEAFVTLARNNSDVFGCLVLGSSLLLCRTTRTTCVLVSDAVNPAFVPALSSVFHEVQHVRSLDSLGTTKLSLLDLPELGISFSKLNVWRLEQFTNCVYLNPDTLVVQNCDELFYHEELSAVPDIGWPDCFNSAVFVFKPSVQTFWQLVEFAEKQGSYDGGDQGLLNTYFSSWSQDIHKRLSFIYNLMANVSYTYTPAFKQFGGSVKIVQFMGPYKPWHVKFYSSTGQIAPPSTVHPTYVQFVHVWLNVFRVSVLPLFSQEIQKFSSSQNVISANELLRFFPSPMDADAEFLLAPPSVRLRPIDSQQSVTSAALQKLNLPLKVDTVDASRMSSLVPPLTPEEGLLMPTLTPHSEDQDHPKDIEPESDDVFVEKEDEDAVAEETAEEDQELSADSEAKRRSLIPGSEVGDYHGMTAWEQGRMDYQGAASSDTIIQRLHYLMGNPDRLV